MVRINVTEPALFLSARISWFFVQEKQGLIDLAVN